MALGEAGIEKSLQQLATSRTKFESRCSQEFSLLHVVQKARGSVAGWGTMQQARRSTVRVPDEVDCFNWPNPSSHTMALGSAQTLTELSTRNLPGGKKRPGRRADNLAAICEPNVWNVGASTSRNPKGHHGMYRDNFTLTCTTPSRPRLGPTQPPIHWLPEALSPEIKLPGREADH
jgi:hypothetical protein